MALAEKMALASVEVCHAAGMVNVKWECQILRDEEPEPISRTPHRKCYTIEQLEEFRAEVPGAVHYIDAIGWI